ncbi:hypothetical protein FBUS_07631 [Fasciolopsis buskii]|uniref:Uncharacterized protein n=1 Tax=Fasciolopsis buskii TaxID=27845 RepID=A0A8E0RTB0_9TREM|nr:hypothetical protein FBUS_07631 [Fasciolopsis buski]
MQNFDFNSVEETKQPLSEQGECENPPDRTIRRKSSRHSILPCVRPDSICQSSGNNIVGLPILPSSLAISPPTDPPEKADDGESMRLSDGCANSIDIVERYHREIDDWDALLRRFENKLSDTTTSVSRLQSPQWVQEDRVVSRYSEVLLPICEDGENYTNKALIIRENLQKLHKQVIFDLTCLPDLLERQNGFIKAMRQSVLLDCSLMRTTLGANFRTVDSVVEDFLSVE